MTDKEIVERAKAAEKRTGFGELVGKLISSGVNSPYGIGFMEGMVEYRNSLQEEPVKIDRQVSRMADEFAEREYETNGYERQWLSKGYYHGYMDAGKGKLKEPVSEGLKAEIKSWLDEGLPNEEELVEHIKETARHFANWQKEQMIVKAVDGVVTFDYYDSGDKTYGCIAHDSFCLEDLGLKDTDKVKVIVIKED